MSFLNKLYTRTKEQASQDHDNDHLELSMIGGMSLLVCLIADTQDVSIDQQTYRS